MHRIPHLASTALLAVALAACGSASADAPSAPASVAAGAVHVVARGIAFEAPSGAAPAGRAFQLAFDNQDPMPHDVAIVAADGSKVFGGAIVNGPARTAYAVPALAAGTYHLKCTVHPAMDATLAVR
jgi:plastocyanin